MLDLKAIRDDPAPVREALARRRDGSDERLDRVLALDVRRRELLPEVEGIKAQQNAGLAGDRRGQEGGRGRGGGDRRDAGGRRGAGKALREELDGVQAELDAALAALPNPPDPTAADEDEVLHELGEPGATGKDHLELAGDVDRHGGGRARGRLALRLPQGRPRAARARARALGARGAARSRASSR